MLVQAYNLALGNGVRRVLSYKSELEASLNYVEPTGS